MLPMAMQCHAPRAKKSYIAQVQMHWAIHGTGHIKHK
jgi:hypothetical protein